MNLSNPAFNRGRVSASTVLDIHSVNRNTIRGFVIVQRESQRMADDKLRLPPQNLDAERGVLGSILLMNEAIDEVGETLKAEHFYSDAHQTMYAAIQLTFATPRPLCVKNGCSAA